MKYIPSALFILTVLLSAAGVVIKVNGGGNALLIAGTCLWFAFLGYAAYRIAWPLKK